MNDMSNNPPRVKLKKVKKPIKRYPMEGANISVPSKISDNPFAATNVTGSSAFNLEAFLEEKETPLPPQPEAEAPLQQASVYSPSTLERSFIRDEDIATQPQTFKDRMMVGDLYTGFAIMITAAIFMLFGIMFSKVFLSSTTTVQNGLQDVVVNSEIPRGRARCGKAEKTQGCILYIMNPQRQDLSGRDFYDLAAQLTGRQRFMIETGNMRYASVKIRPGEIAQINIPPLQ